MKTYIPINIIKLLVFFLTLSCIPNTGLAQNQDETQSETSLIRKGATYMGARVGTSIRLSRFRNGESGYSFDLGGKALYAFSDFFAFGGDFGIIGENNSSVFPNSPSQWLFALGPSAGFFVPNKSIVTPYANLTLGVSHLRVGKSMIDKTGLFYSGSLGIVAEITHFFGIALEYTYAMFDFPDLAGPESNLGSISNHGLALGILFSF